MGFAGASHIINNSIKPKGPNAKQRKAHIIDGFSPSSYTSMVSYSSISMLSGLSVSGTYSNFPLRDKNP